MDESRRRNKSNSPTPKHLLGMSDKNETKHSIAETDLSLHCTKNILVENRSVKINREWSGGYCRLRREFKKLL